jgi:hypothetical protein
MDFAADSMTFRTAEAHMYIVNILLTWRGAAIWPRWAATLERGTMSPAAAALGAPFSSGTTLSPSSDDPPLRESILHGLHRLLFSSVQRC